MSEPKPSLKVALQNWVIIGLIVLPLVLLFRACSSGEGNRTVDCQQRGLEVFYATNGRNPTGGESAEIARMCIDSPNAFGG